MAIVQLAALLAIIFGAYKASRYGSDRLSREFNGFQFYSKKSFIAITGGYVFLLGGSMWVHQSMLHGSDRSNGIAIICIGVAMLASIVYKNIKGTNLTVGIGVSAVQLPFFGVLAYFGSALLIIVGLILLVMPGVMGNGRTVRIVN